MVRKLSKADATNSQSASGISFKSQVLYLLVYVTRYLGTPCVFLLPVPSTIAMMVQKGGLKKRWLMERMEHNRYLHNIHTLGLEYPLQNRLRRLVCIHDISHAKRLQADA